MPMAAINGAELFYKDVGAGPPIVFLHGTLGSSSSWAGQVACLSPQFRCIAYDRRGSSRSPYVAVGNLERTGDADDAAALIRLLGAPRCILVASSAGGRVALDLLLRHPGLVRGTVLAEPAVFELDPDEVPPSRPQPARRCNGPLPTGGRALPSTHSPSWWILPSGGRQRRRGATAAATTTRPCFVSYKPSRSRSRPSAWKSSTPRASS